MAGLLCEGSLNMRLTFVKRSLKKVTFLEKVSKQEVADVTKALNKLWFNWEKTSIQVVDTARGHLYR
ncbi:hypothetical protein ACJMK2_013649, partial [Sinanodonta woodiana]